MNDSELVSRIISNDEKAFRLLVERYQTMVINTCYGFIHDQEDAQDLAQDVFIEVLHSINKFRNEAKISTWLYRIAVNKSLNYIRGRRKFQWLRKTGETYSNNKQTNDGSASELTDHDTPVSIIENKERTDALHEAVNALPENQKIAFVLNKFEELSYKEIADVMNITLSAVESLIFRAKKNLQKKLINYYKKN